MASGDLIWACFCGQFALVQPEGLILKDANGQSWSVVLVMLQDMVAMLCSSHFLTFLHVPPSSA